MIISGPKSLGPIARRLFGSYRWKDKYPTWPDYAKELDALLQFADDQGRLPHFIPRLKSKAAQRDETIEELRVAYFLHLRHISYTSAVSLSRNGSRRV